MRGGASARKDADPNRIPWPTYHGKPRQRAEINRSPERETRVQGNKTPLKPSGHPKLVEMSA